MLDSSAAYRKAIRESGRVMSIHDTYTFQDGTEPTMNTKSFMKYSINEATSDLSSFSIGATVIKKYIATLSNSTGRFDKYDFKGLNISAKVGLLLPDGKIEITPKGKYRCVEAKFIENTINIEAYDSMLFFDKPYSESTLVYPATILQIIEDACRCCHMAFNAKTIVNGDLVIDERPDDASITFRDIIGYCAQMMCRYAIIDKLDQLSFGWYNFSILEKMQSIYDGGTFDTGDTPYSDGDVLDGGNFTDYSSGDSVDGGTFDEQKLYHHLYSLSSQSINTDDVRISGIAVKPVMENNDDIIYLYGEKGYVLEVKENPLIQTMEMAEYMVKYIGEELVGKKFRPLSISCQSNPCIEAGDCACVTDRKQRTFFTVITNTTFSFGSLQEVECSAETDAEKNYIKYSATTKILNKAKKESQKQVSAYNLAVQQLTNLITNSFGVFKTEEPQEDGSIIYFLHNKPELSSSSTIWKMTSDTFSVSTDGGKTWNAGMDSEGNAVVNVLNAIGINANWMITGRISDKKGKNFWNLDTGELSLQAVSELETKTIMSVDVMYALSDSTTTAPTSGWSTTAPTWASGKYMWQKIVVTYADETTEETDATCISGATGQAGKDGVGIQSVTNYYLATSSTDVTTDTTGWTTKVQTISISKKYLWNYEVITYTDKTTATTTPCIIGTYGSTGATGNGIKSITEHYAVSSSNSTAPTSWSDTVPTLTAESKYLWNYETITYTNNETVDTSKRVIGVYGDKGNPGDNGVGIKSITNYYLATESSSGVTTDTVGWTTSVQTITASKKYLWNYENVTYTNDTTSSTTPCIIGTYGSTGATGNGISSITEYYAVSNSNSTAPTSWSTEVPAMTDTNKYLWNYEKITYTNKNTAETSKRVIGVYGDKGLTGNGVKAVTEQYYLSSSSTAQTGGAWSEKQPEWKEGYYIWTRSHITWTDGTETYTEPVLANAINGANQSVSDLNKSLNYEEIFKRLTNDGAIQGMFMKDGQLYINASYLYGGSITTSSFKAKGSVVKYASDYTQDDVDRINNIMLGNTECTLDDLEKYDMDGDLHIKMVDLVVVNRLVTGQIESYTKDTSIEIDPFSVTNILKTLGVAIGIKGVYAQMINGETGYFKRICVPQEIDGGTTDSYGKTGSFTTADGKTVTVTQGIITNIF